jgi:hypothetical protein
MEQNRNPILLFSLPLFVLIVGTSLTGLFHTNIYQGFTSNWLAQTVGQDAIDFTLIAPFLLVSAFFAYRGNEAATEMWVGTLFYLLYTFLIYCFTVRFNILFIPYCLILGLSFYSLVWFFATRHADLIPLGRSRVVRITAIYFIVIAILFYALWLMEIVPATLRNETPATIVQAGLSTNPVHIVDLALFLPATFLVGLLALNGKPSARLLIPAFLTFFILMDITIASLAVMMMYRGLDGNYVVPSVMMCLALFSVILLIIFSKKVRLT